VKPLEQTADGIVRDEQALSIFYLSLALIVVGVGFLKPNISTVVGKLYPEGDPGATPASPSFIWASISAHSRNPAVRLAG
jgi:dipeptide/tripeptide permease